MSDALWCSMSSQLPFPLSLTLSLSFALATMAGACTDDPYAGPNCEGDNCDNGYYPEGPEKVFVPGIVLLKDYLNDTETQNLSLGNQKEGTLVAVDLIQDDSATWRGAIGVSYLVQTYDPSQCGGRDQFVCPPYPPTEWVSVSLEVYESSYENADGIQHLPIFENCSQGCELGEEFFPPEALVGEFENGFTNMNTESPPALMRLKFRAPADNQFKLTLLPGQG